MTNPRDDAEQQAAARDLDKLRRQGDAIGGIFSRGLKVPAGNDNDDPVEVWGTRIGRALSAVALAALCLYLLWTYLR